jgi:hypothetical protein
VGHVDSGKSTLSGRLLHLLGKISKRDMHKNEKEAKEKVSCYGFVSASLLFILMPHSYQTVCVLSFVYPGKGVICLCMGHG